MPSTYSPNLRIQLIASGEQANTWGNTTNTNLGTVIEQAIAGYQAISVAAGDVTLTALDGVSDQSRNAVLQFTGTPGVARSVYCPAGVTKIYVLYNTCGSNVTLYCGTSGSHGTGVTVPTATAYQVFCDGTNIVRVS